VSTRRGMVTASQGQIASVQAVIFVLNTPFSQQKVLADLIANAGDHYDGPVTSLPLPEDAPSNLPRILLQSANGEWRLSVAPARIDSVWSPPPSMALADVTELARLVAQCSNVLIDYARRTNAAVGRLALVVHRAHRVENPAQVLIDHFCSEESRRGPFRNSRSFEIHNHKLYQLPQTGQTVNSWMRCRTALIKGDNGIDVEQDVNTPEDEMNNTIFDADIMHRFYGAVRQEMDSIMDVYFPEAK